MNNVSRLLERAAPLAQPIAMAKKEKKFPSLFSLLVRIYPYEYKVATNHRELTMIMNTKLMGSRPNEIPIFGKISKILMLELIKSEFCCIIYTLHNARIGPDNRIG